ncbi:MAG: response regulator [Melioribacteraceae bacterium]|nr:response regulator [Melioribacteraceae bacterium]
MELKKTILIIDDDDNIFKLLSTILRSKFNVNIKRAINGLEGLKMVSEFIPDGVILDISMPVLNGIQTLEIMRGNEKLKNIPVFIISAISDAHTFAHLKRLQITDFLIKPFTIQDIVVRFTQFLNHQDHVVIQSENCVLIAGKNAVSIQEELQNEIKGDFIATEDGIIAYESFLLYKPILTIVCENVKNIPEELLTMNMNKLINERFSKENPLINFGIIGYKIKNNAAINPGYFQKFCEDIKQLKDQIKLVITNEKSEQE